MDPVIAMWWTSNGLLRIELDAKTAQALAHGLTNLEWLNAPEMGILSTMLSERLLKPQRRKDEAEERYEEPPGSER